jgi:hypothetical protein
MEEEQSMANETPEQIRQLPDYIENRARSGLIRGWGGPFEISLRPDGARAILLQRRACSLGADPLAGGEFAATGIYGTEQQALAAVGRVAALARDTQGAVYAHYRGPENVILPTIICDTTTPNVIRVLRALVEQEGRDAQAVQRTLIEVFLTFAGLRGVGAAARINPGAGRVPGPPTPATLAAPARATSAVAASSGFISRVDMLRRVVAIWERTPLLQRLARARTLAGQAQHRELINILAEFERTAQVTVQRVQTGVVQATRGSGNLASLRSRPGFLQIEQQVFENTTTLLNEVTHELSFFYSQPQQAFCGPYQNTLLFLEMAVTDGIQAVRTLLSP